MNLSSLQSFEPGDPIWPGRFHDEELTTREVTEGRSTFAMQYMLLTSEADHQKHPLRLKDLIVFPVTIEKAPICIYWGTKNQATASTRLDIPSQGFGDDGFFGPIYYDKDFSPYTGTKMWIDPSGAGKDKTGYSIISHLNGKLFCHECDGLEGGFGPDVLAKLCVQARTHHVNDIYIEDNFGQGMMEPLLMPILAGHFLEAGENEAYPDGWRCGTETITVRGQKETRIIENLEPIVNQHRLVVSHSVAENQDLQYQYTRITRQRQCLAHEDELESLAMCCRMWQDVLSQDPDQAAQRQRDRWIDEKLKEHRILAGQLAGAEKPRWFSLHSK